MTFHDPFGERFLDPWRERRGGNGALEWRQAFHTRVLAAQKGCAPEDYLKLHPRAWVMIARRAITDILAMRAGCFPSDPVIDELALNEAILRQQATAQPITQWGNIEQRRMFREAAVVNDAAKRLRAANAALRRTVGQWGSA